MSSGGTGSGGLRGTLNNLVGFRGRQNIFAWIVAGSLAYYFYVKPEQERAEEQRLARQLAEQLASEQALREAASRDTATDT